MTFETELPKSNSLSIWQTYLGLTVALVLSILVSVAHSQDSSSETETATSVPLWKLTYRDHEGKSVTTEGRILTRAADGGLLLERRDGYLLNVIPDAIIEQQQTTSDFSYLTSDELATSLQQELGTGFLTHQTEHYVLLSELSPDYTEWAGTLLEQMYGQFFREWSKAELKLHEPRCPLPILLFQDRERFQEYVKTELLQDTLPNQGFYSVRTNRVVLIDLAEGKTWLEARNARAGDQQLAEAMLNTSTIVHEGVHQLCYNTGMLARFSDAPLWLSEGIALYFETPSQRSRTGWGGSGRINNSRLFRFRDFMDKERPDNSLTTLISSNSRLEQQETALNAYAESWLFTSFLMKRRRQNLETYLKSLGEKTPFVWDDTAKRTSDFEAAFGKEWEDLEKEFLNFVRRLRPSR
ncbi:hypothetical protein Pla110_27700 [Polystyrenella longa]|uniref:DUF1570 domain-containing protein n=1 Tax=Polystyrenella longa TaxID=2528007 RepID=A0A518CP97_9PLAN|nr:DUF1570 domain-containing protein [Polystyrenella longa]QDU81033.1 hypothetical protein Pla110_27700 [Polystyrenella longa]